MVAAWYGTRRKTHRDGRQECRSRSTTDGRPMALHPRSPVQRRVTILRRLKTKNLRALRFHDCDGGPMALRSPKTTNFNGKSWLNEVGEIVSYAETVVERFTPVDRNTINYQATATDPLVYTRPWTIAFLLMKQQHELLD